MQVWTDCGALLLSALIQSLLVYFVPLFLTDIFWETLLLFALLETRVIAHIIRLCTTGFCFNLK